MSETLQLKPDYDTVISRIGFGFYHYYIFLIAFLFSMLDGAELTLLSLLNPILLEVWNLDS